MRRPFIPGFGGRARARSGDGHARPRHLAGLIAVAAAAFAVPFPAIADPELPDPGYFARSESAPASSGERGDKHLYTFGVPYKWPATFAWRYNDAGRPASLSKADLIAGVNAAAAQWMAACNVRIVQDPAKPETTTAPQTINGTALSLNENVLGWGDLALSPAGASNLSGVTFTSSLAGALVDADMTYSSRYVTNASILQRVAVHELGHALGLAHSNVEGQVMSGPPGSGNPGVPPTEYAGVTELQADDIQGCLCLYGPSAANAGKGYLCGLPTYRDFGAVALGATSATQSITLRNAATSGSVTLGPITYSSPEFQTVAGCPVGTTLGPGASCTLGVVHRPGGAPGPREGVVRIATGVLGPYEIPLVGNATASTSVPSNYQGLWWNAPAGSEPGWGINFAHQGDTLFATWFTFDFDGSPLWMVVAAPKAGANAYAGTLYRGTGPAFNAAPFDPTQVAGIVAGSASFTFADADNGAFSYSVGGVAQTKAITREVFASPVPVCTWGEQPNLAAATNYQGLWWAAPAGSESGWGINFTHQGDTIFATWFTFAADGKPLWLTVSATPVAPKVYSGVLYTGTGPAFNAVPFDPAKVVATPAGTATFEFADGNSAIFSYTLNGSMQAKAITREVFAAPGTTCR